MGQPVKPRRYDATRRRARSAEHRHQILKAAHELILVNGYRATTVAAVARRAGVNVDTVYALVGRKPVLLRELIEQAISGTDHPVVAEQRSHVVALRAEPEPVRKLEIYARAVRETQARLAPLFLALREAGATDEEARNVWQEISDRRAENMRRLVRDLRTAGGLREGLSISAAADTVWATTSPELYVLLTVERRWSPRRFEQWLLDTWVRLLLP